MTVNQVSSPSLQIVENPPRRLEEYQPFVPEVLEEIRELVAPLKGMRVAHVNATPLGGGVAEMLRYQVPLQRDVGLDSYWYVIPPDDAFFEVTKSIHNFMQGKEGDLTDAQKRTYLEHNKVIGGLLAQVDTDILIIHDPQPAAALDNMNGKQPQLAVWRCHIDTSHPNQSVWNFMMPLLKGYDQFIFTMPEYTHREFPEERVNLITPVIDPLSPKNVRMDVGEARQYLEQFGIDSSKPLATQVSRFDPWKDPKGVIDAFRIAKQEVPDLQLAMVAQMAPDDPEGVRVYEDVQDYAGGGKDIFLLVNLPDNDVAVNAFQSGSDVVLQKSIREGFGLTITEAMWKGGVVIGGDVGGIRIQIEDGVNGFRVNSPEEAAEKMVYIVNNPEAKEKLSQAAHESVKHRYLMPHSLRNYLKLFREALG